LKKHLVLAVAAAAAVMFAAFGPGLAGAAVTPTGVTDTIYMKAEKGALGFVAPSTVHQGDDLKVINETDPKKVGPHTFSLVTKGSLPKTPKVRKNCFTPKHICMSIAKWHGFNPKTEKVTINPARRACRAGAPSAAPPKGATPGSPAKRNPAPRYPAGDAEPGTLYFFCAIHPWMQGKTTVLPAGS